LKARKQATDQKGSQLNMVEARKPSLLSKIKDYFRRRRIKLATVSRANYEQAIIHQASVAVPMMLDTIETMHESLTILEELLAKHKERQKITQSEKHPRQ
jgi:acyl-CoA reductase-like NAD-dependent aldehyde dehydrogenase